MQQTLNIRLRVAAFSVTLFWLTGCATQLAPMYDKSLADSLTTANAETLTLVASVKNGPPKDSFATRQANYNKIIADWEALELLADARPAPTGKLVEDIKRVMQGHRSHTTPSKGSGDSTAAPSTNDIGCSVKDVSTLSSPVPSTIAIQCILSTVESMSDHDEKNELNATVVAGIKGQLLIYMDQAVTYEAALQR